jgi:hypothetical protein
MGGAVRARDSTAMKPLPRQYLRYLFTMPYPLLCSAQSVEKFAGAFLCTCLRKAVRVLRSGFSI